MTTTPAPPDVTEFHAPSRSVGTMTFTSNCESPRPGTFRKTDRCTQRSPSRLRRSKCYPLGAITAIMMKWKMLDTLLIRYSMYHEEKPKSAYKEVPCDRESSSYISLINTRILKRVHLTCFMFNREEKYLLIYAHLKDAISEKE